MAQKKLVFDVVFITENEEIFELRFKEIYNYIDYFLIFGTEENLKNIERYYGVINHKIKTFVLSDIFDSTTIDIKITSNLILDTIKELYSSFEDLIFFSYSNEIPNVKSFIENDIKIKEVQILKSDVFECDFSRKRKFSEVGPILVNFSHILKNKKVFLYSIFDLKNKMICNDVIIQNGYKILNYRKTPQPLPTYYYCPSSKKDVEYKFERNFRKFVFVFDEKRGQVYGDHIFQIKFKDSFPENTSIDLSKNLHFMEIYQPKHILYGNTINEFKEQYKFNEISRVLSIFNCQDEDEIEVHYDKKRKVKLKYLEIKNPSF